MRTKEAAWQISIKKFSCTCIISGQSDYFKHILGTHTHLKKKKTLIIISLIFIRSYFNTKDILNYKSRSSGFMHS